ncbi:MAG: transglutaminase-like domain-containing protein [Solirubrobacterales bacterium]
MTALAGDRSARVELACFAALAALAALQWTSLVAHPPAGRVVVAVLFVTAAGAAIAAIARLELSRAARLALAAVATVAGICFGMVVVGLPARLLLPGHWEELGANLSRSLDGVADVPVPYSGADAWTRLAILLASPLVVGLAAFAAFWPTRRRVAGRISALVLLVALYLIALAWARPGRQLAGGILLAILIAAWLWLPGIAPRSRGAASIAVIAAAVVALPAAAAIDTGRGLIDYRHWDLLSANGQSFNWDQTYGPLDWPQKGTPLMEVASEHSHYWKTTNLDEFNGTRWIRATAPGSEPALGEPLKFHPKGTVPRPPVDWIDRINFTDRGLSSDFAVGAGTVLAISRIQARPAPDAIWSMTNELRPGDSYTALVYDPKPSPAEMRAAGTGFPAAARHYVSFDLPGRTLIQTPYWGRSGPASIADQVRGTPYLGMYELARRLAVGARTPYEAAQRIELYLRNTYAYRQNVPQHEYPLPAFLSQDRAGYCQQFSGTMALMLRMLGIPSRVSTGFAPGGRDPERNNFLVDDTDAHDWVEVFFPAIGWVTFEPTPAAAPAATQLDDNDLGVTKSPVTGEKSSGPPLPQTTGGDTPKPKPTASGARPQGGGEPGPSVLVILIGAAGAGALGALSGYAYRSWRRGRLSPDQLAGAELAELDRALMRIGSPMPPGTTLLRVQGLLDGLAGATAADYASALLERRYRDPDAAPPGLTERRALRRALLRAAGRRSALRVLFAVPPGGPATPRRGRGGSRTSR